MSKPRKTPIWRMTVESFPGSKYLLSEEEPQKFNHVAFLLFLKPSSHERRDITNKWLREVVPSLKSSARQELQEAGHRLEREWTSKAAEREAFWTDLTETEERLEYLKTAGEKRLRSAEGYLVEKTQHDFDREAAKFRVGDGFGPLQARKTHRSEDPLKDTRSGSFEGPFVEVSVQQGTPKQDTMLGKRGRTYEDEPNYNERVKEDESESLKDEDPVRIAQTVPNAPMNVVFDVEDYEFTGKLGEVDVGKEFTAYYDHCRPLSYDSDNLADFVALSGVLFLEDRPTSLQKTYFGAKYKQLLSLIDMRVKYPTADEVADAVQMCRDVKDAYNKVPLSRFGAKNGRVAMEETLEKAPRSALRSLLLHGTKLHQKCVPLSETDQTSHFILGTLSHIMDKPDETRLAHTASAPLTGSVLLRVYFELEQLPRHPDVVVRYHEAIDIGVGEVSLSGSKKKDQGDLARTLLWSKRAADEIVTRFEDVEDMNILFVQVIGQTCNLYVMCRIGTVCVATKIGSMKILYTLSDTLSFEDQVQTWLTLDKTFNSAVSVLNDATYRRSDSAPPPCFPGLSTPRSRKMKADANRGRV